MQRITTISVLFILFVAVAGTGASHDVAFAGMTESMTTVVAGQPMLEVTKSCPKMRYIGRDAAFEITVANKGDGPAHDVVVTDVITGEIEFKSADQNGTHEGGNIVWRLGTLAAGESRTFNTVYRCNQIGRVGNKVTVTYCAEVSDTCELEVKGISAILLECVDDPDPIEINSSVTYSIKVLNQGSAVGTNIVIACTLPPEQEYLSSTGPTNAKAQNQKVTFASLKSLAPKATVVYKVTAKGIGEGDVRFRVEMTSDQIKTPVMETESTHIYE